MHHRSAIHGVSQFMIPLESIHARKGNSLQVIRTANYLLASSTATATATVIPTMGRMHGDAQFAGSSSVPAHVEMMGLIGAGNNPMVGMTVAVAVAIEEASK